MGVVNATFDLLIDLGATEEQADFLVLYTRATAKSTGNQMLGYFAELMAYFEKVGEMGDPAEANQLLGAPATTLDDWLAEMNVARTPE
jgi:predicted membrane GTPase involved in stress response